MKKKDSQVARQLMDSLLDDVEEMESSFAPPSETVSIAGLSPYDPKRDNQFKKSVEKATSFIPSEGDAGQGLGEDEDFSAEGTAAILWGQVDEPINPNPLDSSDKSKVSGNEPNAPSAEEDGDHTIAIAIDAEESPEGLNISSIEKALRSQSKSKNDEDFDASENTVPAAARHRPKKEDPTTKVRFGAPRSQVPLRGDAAKTYASPDASLVQAESLKLAQDRILQLESELEKVRAENEELASAGETFRDRLDELESKLEKLERNKKAQKEDLENEMMILKNRISFKDGEVEKLKIKKVELENRLQRDFKKVRVRERELENRLELAKMENVAVIRSKDETILDLKRRIDQLESESEAYRQKCQELNHQIDGNQDQFRRTVKALRLALTNLEVDDESLAPFKKAE